MEVIVGAVIAILVATTIEYLRRPKLELSIESPHLDVYYPPGYPATNARYLRLRLANRPLPWFARWMLRSAALQCRGVITFHHLDDGQNIFGREMAIRWSGSPQPIPSDVVNMATGQVQYRVVDLTRITTDSRMDVYPGENELFDVAVRLDADTDCYGWNNEAYFSQTLWRSQNWRLAPGRYLVRARIKSSGQTCTGVVRLINDVPRTDCRLEPATKADRAKIRG